MRVQEYTDIDTLEKYTLTTIAAQQLDQVDSWIRAMSNHIARYTGRQFQAETTATPRVFNGDAFSNLLIDDAVEITKVENSYPGGAYSEIPAGGTGYYTLPGNALSLGYPLSEIAYDQGFYTGNQNVQVTAKWGYSTEPPEEIKLAATILVAGIMNSQRNDVKEVTSERIGNYTVSYAKDSKEATDFAGVQDILQQYVRYTL